MKGYSLGSAFYFTVLSAKCGMFKAIIFCLPVIFINITGSERKVKNHRCFFDIFLLLPLEKNGDLQYLTKIEKELVK